MKQLSCSHYFCETCCKEWFKDNRKCPVCNKEFQETTSPYSSPRPERREPVRYSFNSNTLV